MLKKKKQFAEYVPKCPKNAKKCNNSALLAKNSVNFALILPKQQNLLHNRLSYGHTFFQGWLTHFESGDLKGHHKEI